MLKRDRLIPLRFEGVHCGMLTYFIGNGNIDKYVRDDSWSVVDDEPETGTTCYIDQLIAYNTEFTRRHSLEIWHNVKAYLKHKYPQLKCYRWNRFIDGRVNIHKGRF